MKSMTTDQKETLLEYLIENRKLFVATFATFAAPKLQTDYVYDQLLHHATCKIAKVKFKA